MKFDIDIPKEANWMAQDEDGSWWVYKNKPFYAEPYKQWDIDDGSFTERLVSGTVPKNAKYELYKLYWS